MEFGAVKAISDGVDFNMPAMERFVAADGTFASLRFAVHVAVRPWLWGSTMALSRNSAKASRALCSALAKYLGRESGAHPLSPEPLGHVVNQSEVISGRGEGE